MEEVLPKAVLKEMRASGVLSNDEIALKAGDLVIAENVITRQRRIIKSNDLFIESKQRILKG